MVRKYRGGITRDFLVLGVVVFFCSSFTIGYGIYIERTWTHRGIPFICLGLIFIIALLTVLYNIYRIRLYLTSTQVVYWKANHRFSMDYGKISVVSLPSSKKQRFRTILIGDEHRVFRIDSFTFPQFDQIVKDLTSLRKLKRARRLSR